MPIPFLHTLNLRARTAYPIIRRGVREGLSNRGIAETLRNNKLGINNSVLGEIVRREKAIIQHGQNLKFLPVNRRPNPEKLPVAITQQLREYAYTVRMRWYIEDTGELYTRHITVSSSKLLTRGEAQSIAEEMMQDNPENYPLDFLDSQLVFVQRSGEFGTIL